MYVAKMLLVSILILQTNLVFGIEISGFVIRSTVGPSPASVYANGTRIAVASDNGYFQGEVTEGNIEIYAELNLANGVERSIPRQVNLFTDTKLQLYIAPVHRVTINSELPAGTYGPWLTIYEAVTPSERLFNTDLQILPLSTLPSGGYSHKASYDLPEGVYRALLSAQTGVSGERYNAWAGFEVTSETKEITITPQDEYSSYPAEVRIIDPARIDFSPDELEGYLTIHGNQGAASPNMALTILNLQTGHYTWGSSRDDGSFSLVLNGLPGSEYAIYQRPEIDGWNNYQLGVGTTIRAPLDSPNSLEFSTEHSASSTNHTPNNPSDAKLLGGRVGGIAQYSGEFDFSQLSSGSSGEISGTVKVVAPSLEDVSISWGTSWPSGLYLEKIVSTDGWVVAANPENSSNYMTVSGLPINGEPEVNRTRIGNVAYSEIEQISSTVWRATFVASYDIPPQLSKGRYQLHLKSSLNTSVSSEKVFSHNFTGDSSTSVLDGRIGEFEIGDTSRTNIDVGLFLNEYSNGSRGTVPDNRSGEFGITPGIITNAHKFLIDGSMPGRKDGASYNLEPFIPLVSWTTKGHQVPLPIKFKFPSGKLEVAVVDPAGNVSSFGPKPFRGTYMNEPFILNNTGGGMGGAAPQVYMKLTTLTEDFDYDFKEYGEYKISIFGTVLDMKGREYSLNGDFTVVKAEPLDLEHGVMPGTPFEIGDSFSPQLIVQPGVPAKVEITLSHYPNSDPAMVETAKFTGFANRFGYYDGGDQEYKFKLTRRIPSGRFCESRGYGWRYSCRKSDVGGNS